MGALYAKDGKIYCNTYTEIYVPKDYDEDFSFYKGDSVETLGLLYIRSYDNGIEGPIQLLNIPAIIDVMIYDSEEETINIHDRSVHVVTLKYLKDSFLFQQNIQQGKNVAEKFLNYILNGKLPKTLDYARLIDIWWKNLQIAKVDFRVPSKIYEMILAHIYRNPHDMKQRFGEYYGKQPNSNGYGYKTGNVRDIVEGLSTFSGMVFEDINRMITTGINNSIEGIEEPVSPLEKIIYY